MNVHWSVSRGKGGFKASYEEVQARTLNDGTIEVVFITPIGVTHDSEFESEEKAVNFAKKLASCKGFDV